MWFRHERYSSVRRFVLLLHIFLLYVTHTHITFSWPPLMTGLLLLLLRCAPQGGAARRGCAGVPKTAATPVVDGGGGVGAAGADTGAGAVAW